MKMISYVIVVVVVFAYSGRVASEASGASGLKNKGHSFLIYSGKGISLVRGFYLKILGKHAPNGTKFGT